MITRAFQMNIRLNGSERAMLMQLAQQERRGAGETVREAIRAYAEVRGLKPVHMVTEQQRQGGQADA